MKNKTKWHFYTNISKCTLQHVLICCEYSELQADFDDIAIDMFGNKVEDAVAMYIPQEQVGSKEDRLFSEVYTKLSLAYKKLLKKKCGLKPKDIDFVCYLGDPLIPDKYISMIKDLSVEEIINALNEPE